MSRMVANSLLVAAGVVGVAIYYGGVLEPSPIACDQPAIKATVLNLLTKNTDLGIRTLLLGQIKDENGNPIPTEILSTETLDYSSLTVSRCRALVQFPDIQGRVTTGVPYTVQKTDDGRISVTLYR